MPTHPGHPALQITHTLAESRGYINNAIDSVSVQSLTNTTTVDPDSGRYILVSPAANMTLTLPDPASSDRNSNIVLIFKRLTGGATCTIDVSGGGTIDGQASIAMNTQYDRVVLFNNGTAGEWYREQ